MMDRGDRDELNRDADKENIPVDDGRGEKTVRHNLQYFYSKDELFDISENPTSKKRPMALLKDFDTAEGYWDPEKWIKSFDGVRGDSPSLGLEVRKRRSDLDRDGYSKRPSSDPKERLKEERDGIVLSPQRKSFMTGCHVTQAQQQKRAVSPVEHRDQADRDRRDPQRRIGSGRIPHDRDREQHDYRNERNDRFDDRDRRFDRNDRFRDRNDDQNRDNNNRREYGSRRFSGTRRPHRSAIEEEPEWFTGGPRSQSDTIELRGFEDPSESSGDGDDDNHETRRQRVSSIRSDHSDKHENQEVPPPETQHSQRIPSRSPPPQPPHQKQIQIQRAHPPQQPSHHPAPQPQMNPPVVVDAPPGNFHSQMAPGSEFNFDEFFNIDTIPMLGGNPMVVEDESHQPIGSRFSRWFSNQTPVGASGSHHSSRNGSRRSSLTEDFNFINEILGGQKSPSVPSPNDGILDPNHMFSPIPTPADRKQQNILDMLQQSRINVQPFLSSGANNKMENQAHSKEAAPTGPKGPIPEASAVEADLKAILFSGKSVSQPKTRGSPKNKSAYGGQVKVKTLAELEAGLQEPRKVASPKPHPQAPPPQIVQNPGMDSDMTAFNKLVGMMVATGNLGAKESPPPVRKAPSLQHPPITILTPDKNGDTPPPQQNQQRQLNILQDILASQQHSIQLQQQQQLQQKLQEQQQQQQHQQQQQKLQEQQQHQQKIQEQKLQQQLQQQLQIKLLQHQQQLQQQQQQKEKMLSRNPTIVTKPASPTMMQLLPNPQPQPTTPRIASPNIIQQALQLQQASTPRAPSPIMFGQQPPMHLNAPSPIHPSAQASPSKTPVAQQNLSVNTLQVNSGSRSPVLARVPSPQELVYHTQAIMQNALIKKQLEDQKERFMKKQQLDHSKSPNPITMAANSMMSGMPMATSGNMAMAPGGNMAMAPGGNMAMAPGGNMTMAGQPGIGGNMTMVPNVSGNMTMAGSSGNITMAGNSGNMSISVPVPLMPGQNSKIPEMLMNMPQTSMPTPISTKPPPTAFTPTSVIIKMASDKAGRDRGGASEAADSPIQRLSEQMAGQPSTVASPSRHPNQMGGQTGSPQHSVGQARPLFGQGAAAAAQPQIPLAAGPSTASMTNVQSHGHGRPIVKGVMNSPTRPTPQSSQSDAQGQRPITGSQLLHDQKDQYPMMDQCPKSPMTNRSVTQNTTVPNHSNPYNVALAGRVPLPQAAGMRPSLGVPPPNNALMVQQMMQAAQMNSNPAARVSALNQMNQFNQLAALQAQARGIDPRLQVRNVYPGMVSQGMQGGRGMPPNNMSTLGLPNHAAMSRSLSPQPQFPPPLLAQAKMGNGPLSPNPNYPRAASPNPGADLSKWFQMDMLKQHLPAMPPIPGQGQNVLTVDELERRQQVLTN